MLPVANEGAVDWCDSGIPLLSECNGICINFMLSR